MVGFPLLPYEDYHNRFQNTINVRLTGEKEAALESLHLDKDTAIESKTVQQNSSQLWYILCKKRIIGSKFSLVARRVGYFERVV